MGSLFGSLFGSSGTGGASGNKGAQDVNIPAFTSPGGTTRPQTDLARYTMGEGYLANANQFSSTPDSTMLTQADAGTTFGGAQKLGQASDINQGAMYTAYTNQVQSDLAQLAQNAQANTGNLQSTATSLGNLFGSNQGGLTTGTQTQAG